jgi:hypothetical protein
MLDIGPAPSKQDTELIQQLHDMASGARSIVSQGLQLPIYSKYATISAKVSLASLKGTVVHAAIVFALDAVAVSTWSLIFWFMGKLIVNGSCDAAEVFRTFTVTLFSSVFAGNFLSSLPRALDGIEALSKSLTID